MEVWLLYCVIFSALRTETQMHLGVYTVNSYRAMRLGNDEQTKYPTSLSLPSLTESGMTSHYISGEY